MNNTRSCKADNMLFHTRLFIYCITKLAVIWLDHINGGILYNFSV